jgi:hypothetical protein
MIPLSLNTIRLRKKGDTGLGLAISKRIRFARHPSWSRWPGFRRP